MKTATPNRLYKVINVQNSLGASVNSCYHTSIYLLEITYISTFFIKAPNITLLTRHYNFNSKHGEAQLEVGMLFRKKAIILI